MDPPDPGPPVAQIPSRVSQNKILPLPNVCCRRGVRIRMGKERRILPSPRTYHRTIRNDQTLLSREEDIQILIKGCINNDRKAQESLYKRYYQA
jgi:hypothetical protein